MAARKPTALKELAGEKRPSRIPKNEPRYKVVELKPPKGLSEVAHAEWIYAAKLLAGVGVLTVADRTILYGFCSAWSEFIEAEALVEKEGLVIQEQRGGGENAYYITKEHPAYGVVCKARKQYLEFARELGLGPIARQKVQAQEGEGRGEQGAGELVAFDGGKR